MKSPKIAIVFILLFSSQNFLLAQVPPPASGGNPSCWPPPCVPADNGIAFLAIAGVLLGIKKLHDAHKRNIARS
jgi:hypothetical protein